MGYKSTGIVLKEKPSIGIEPTRLFDSSRFKNHGVHTDITMVQLPSGLWVRSLNGSTSKIIIAHDMSLNPTKAMSLEIWVYWFSTGLSEAMMNKGITGGNRGYLLRLEDLSAYPEVWFSQDGSTVKKATHNAAPDLMTWYQYFGVMDGSNVLLYIQGVLVDVEEAITSVFPSTDELSIGEFSDDGGGNIEALVALPRIRNYAPSAGQIKRNFDAQNAKWFGV